VKACLEKMRETKKEREKMKEEYCKTIGEKS
jgi:hypothetical protein